MSHPRIVYAIPAHNEAGRLPACLDALTRQQDARAAGAVVLMDRCTDGTAEVVAARAATCPFPIWAVRDDGGTQPDAGRARGLAMDEAARMAGAGGVVLTTDADTVAPPDWLAANLRALAGVAAVAGRAVIDPAEAKAIPDALHSADAREVAYATALDEILWHIDPEAADPWPRHVEASGASFAVRAEAYAAVGGVPAIPSGEDRALAAALRRRDLPVRHDPLVWVTVSGRLTGRAPGGMAETMRRRMTAPDLFLDAALEPAVAATRRAWLRAHCRAAHAGTRADRARIAPSLGLDVGTVQRALAAPFFGAAWAEVEASSPRLVRRRVPVSDLARQMAAAQAILVRLRAAAGGPADSPAVAESSAATRARRR